MPTGYTADIENGISFEKFILSCARNFGALIMMRDEPNDAPIPDEFKPSDYYIEALKKSNEEFDFLSSLTDNQIKEYSESEYNKSVKDWQKREDEKLLLKNKYNEMLEKAIGWQPPTKDHEGLKEFMISQITKSIEWDCAEYDRPEKLTPKQWINERLKNVRWQIDYQTKENEAEIKRSEGRTEWVRKLKESVY